jgi:hypothetical protein
MEETRYEKVNMPPRKKRIAKRNIKNITDEKEVQNALKEIAKELENYPSDFDEMAEFVVSDLTEYNADLNIWMFCSWMNHIHSTDWFSKVKRMDKEYTLEVYENYL